MENILVIDDNNNLRENISELLFMEGYCVVQAASGKEALLMSRKILPDLILCDVCMEDMDGFDVFEQFKNQPSTHKVPFIFLTALADIPNRCRGLDIGADDYLVKPINDSELVSAVKCRIRKSKLFNQELQQERLSYVKDLEDIAFHISHTVRSPLCSSLGLGQLLDGNIVKNLSNGEIQKILEGIKESNQKMDNCTINLSDKISEFLLKYKKI